MSSLVSVELGQAVLLDGEPLEQVVKFNSRFITNSKGPSKGVIWPAVMFSQSWNCSVVVVVVVSA